MLSIVGPNGVMDLYDGKLRARDADGKLILDNFDTRRYWDVITEEVRSWSYMKFPYLKALGPDEGWYKVGPLARVQNCDLMGTPFADAARREFLAYGHGAPIHATLAYHWARMIEMLFAAEKIKELLHDDDIVGTDLVARGERAERGIGVIEAPRGTLIHHYRVNEDDQIVRANLIVSTTHNNQAMNESIRQVALRHLDGRKITEPLLNKIEVAIRAFDPCLSCATHALGRMPLVVELVDASGATVDRLHRDSRGALC
jgi:NAD-reducing hydrogenase large subunit